MGTERTSQDLFPWKPRCCHANLEKLVFGGMGVWFLPISVLERVGFSKLVLERVGFFGDKCVLEWVGFFIEFESKRAFLQIFGATRQFFSCIKHFGLQKLCQFT